VSFREVEIVSNGDDVTTLTDNLLLERIQQGDTDSFETLFYRHYDRVYGLLYRLVGTRAEAEDLAQEVFVKLYHHTSRKRFFRKRKEHNISAWLYRVATNAGYDALKTRKRRWQRDTLLVPDDDGAPGAEQAVAKREEQARVRAALGRLPQRQAQLLILRQMDLSYAECAVACDVAPGSVGTLLARAAAAFRKEYEDLVDSPGSRSR
jgi:RNA polymerase sigma-70 factor (ECF subfamily)